MGKKSLGRNHWTASRCCVQRTVCHLAGCLGDRTTQGHVNPPATHPPVRDGCLVDTAKYDTICRRWMASAN